MLQEKQFNEMQRQFKDKGQTFCFELDDAREFCKKAGVTKDAGSIVQDHKAGRFYIEDEVAPFVRPKFETQHDIT